MLYGVCFHAANSGLAMRGHKQPAITIFIALGGPHNILYHTARVALLLMLNKKSFFRFAFKAQDYLLLFMNSLRNMIADSLTHFSRQPPFGIAA